MFRVSAGARGAMLALIVLTGTLCHGLAMAAGDVADAAMHQDAARLRALLAKSADVNQPQADGTTALHWAAYHADAATTQQLLAAGAKPAATTDTGVTPLALACEAGAVEAVKLLLTAGADPNQTLSNGETPLMMAARTGSVSVLRELLSHGAKIDARESLRGTTALMWAAANSNTDAVRLLISKGADINAKSGTVKPGRMPYLADPSRDRIQEFVDGRGQGGTVVRQDAPRRIRTAAITPPIRVRRATELGLL